MYLKYFDTPAHQVQLEDFQEWEGKNDNIVNLLIKILF